MTWGRSDEGPVGRGQANEGEFTSALFAEFTSGVERIGADADLLDLGRAVPANIYFWAPRCRRVTVVDVLSRTGCRSEDLGLTDRRFGGICCWNVLDFMAPQQAGTMFADLVRLLLPGGKLSAIFDGDGRVAGSPQRYRIAGDGKLHLEPASHGLHNRAVATSEIERLFAPLKPTRLTVMRHGSREALGAMPRPRS